MTGLNDDRAVADWLRRLKWALAAMPSPEREDIVEEARAHLEEAVAAGQSAEAALAGFGPPDAYGRRFLDEMELTAALGSQRSGALLAAVLGRIHRSLVAALAGLVMLGLSLVALVAVSLLIMKLQDPVHTGLWIGPGQQFIGTIDDPTQARERLGNGLYALSAAALALVWLVGRAVLIWAVRTLAGRR